MALRFNPPPNWPAPPDGFVPPAGWQPDPAWGPAPEGWQLWVDDAAGEGASTSSAPQTSSASDPAWIPTQAVSTGASAAVADPTGAPVSAPSGDYASSQAGPGPAVSSGPMAMSAPSASPYAASMNYSQSPAPYQGGMGAPVGGPQQAPVGMPQQPGWQPIDINNPGGPGGPVPTPVYKQWWFWTIAAVLVVALVGTLVYALSRGDSNSDTRGGSTSTSASKDPDASKDPEPGGSAAPSAQATKGSNGGVGQSVDNPADPTGQMLTLYAGEYSSDPEAHVEIVLGQVEWDATASLEAEQKDTYYEAPGSGNVYMRVPITLTYHGKGQFNPFDLKVHYISDGTSYKTEYLIGADSEFEKKAMPYDNGMVEGYVTFIIPADAQNSGVFAISAFNQEPW